jgi:tetratricopeptide (TPR) repeat protein
VDSSSPTISNLAELVRSGHFDEAALYLSKLEKDRGLTPAELVLKGQLIQLGSVDNTFSLENAEAAFRSALSLDPEYVPALLELGWFLHSAEDNSAQALPLFDRALDLCKKQLKGAVEGRKECVEELESADVAEQFVKQLRRELLHELDFSES